ncbi:hypothetical protein PseAD21_22155 [Pseudomonas sp. AD21]|uniref:hypothetical protein n=1 Tax=Pseudomonas sp. AD21 TaxID=396378 RepID=UPI000C823323|nr:hypothetical protein [Pseudomonas sp. AD21]PMQ09013.1 hypothetical protein PseAD21_22155 [Pseudomonas sp. AD21]
MPVSTHALRLFCAITLVAAMTPVFAAVQEHPENSWQYYLANCQRMQEKMADVQSGRVPGAVEVIGDLESSLRIIAEHRLNLTPQYLGSQEFAQCENVAAQGEATIAQGRAEFAARMNQAAQQGRIAHQNSPEYQRARSLGYSDVGDISFLKLHEDTDGEARLKTMLITVDEICGQYFRATQYVKPYVIYTVRPSDGGCGEVKRVAVVGGRSVEKGDYIDEKGEFQYLGWKKLVGADGFPTDVRVLKARR